MITPTVTITDRATPVILAIRDIADPQRIKPVIGRAVVNVFRTHLFAADRTKPNWLGGARTRFYAAAARGTHFDVVGDGVIISVNQVGFRQRVLGGTIRAKKSKWLTIPVHPEAHGKRAREFNDLFPIFDRTGKPVALARAPQTAIKFRRSGKTGAITGRSVGATQSKPEVMFILRKSITQQPDPTVIPQRFEIAAGAISAVNAVLLRDVEKARAKAAKGKS